MANAIPNVARESNTTTSPILNVWMTFIGVPSSGTPSAIKNTLYMLHKHVHDFLPGKTISSPNPGSNVKV